MARRKRKPQPTTAKKDVDEKMVIRIKPWKVPSGHRVKWCRSGPHADKRTARNRTKADQKRRAIEEQ